MQVISYPDNCCKSVFQESLFSKILEQVSDGFWVKMIKIPKVHPILVKDD